MLTKQPKFKFFMVDESRESIRLRERLFTGRLGCECFLFHAPGSGTKPKERKGSS